MPDHPVRSIKEREYFVVAATHFPGARSRNLIPQAAVANGEPIQLLSEPDSLGGDP
jgi:hypothetical protein